MTRIKPFLKWAGNKVRCIEMILNSLPPANRLIEPFTGSGAIFVNSNYPNYLLAEKNSDLVNLFLHIQEEGHPFIDYCADFFAQQNNCAEKYYQVREQFNQSNDLKYRSAAFLYLNRHGYNGLCRYNQSGFYNVPFGRYINPYFPRDEMIYFYQKSKTAQFIQSDFRHTFAQAQPGDLIYCDPPYIPLSSSAYFSSYTRDKFTEQDHIELASLALENAQKGITVVISNHDISFTRHHYRHGKIISFPVMRSISCQSNARSAVQELVAIFCHKTLIK